ncbi:MAG: LysE family translocator [Sutterellaceae bacterium]|nr:LysE family translocator [Sutterellaceae bacterium]
MHDLALFFVVTVVTCLAPGAGVLFTISNAFRYGIRHAWKSPCGNATGVATMSIISALGMGSVIAASPVLFYGLQTIGACVLIYLGYKSWKAPALNLMAAGKAHGSIELEKASKGVFVSAALLQVTNPMLIVFLLSLLPQFVSPLEEGYAVHVTILLVLFVSICLIVHLGYSYCACLLGTKLRGARFAWWLNHVSAVLFWLLALSVFVNFFRIGV